MEQFVYLYGEYIVWILFGILIIVLLMFISSQEECSNLKKELHLNDIIIKNMHHHLNFKIKCDTSHGASSKRNGTPKRLK